MAKFEFDVEIFKGYHCNGCGESIDAQGSVELDNESVRKVLDLIRENDGETDIRELKLEDKLPEVYSAISEAYRNAASSVCFWDWAIEGYECGYFDRPDGLLQKMEESGEFKFDIEKFHEDYGYEDIDDGEENEEDEEDETYQEDMESAKEEQFEEWLESYYESLDENGKHIFLETYYAEALDGYDGGEYDYEMEIPAGIIAML